MRTIKFRGKSLETGEWVFGYYVNPNGIPYIICENEIDSRFVHRVDPETVGEFTGLLDKTGINEIYEDDIIKVQHPAMRTPVIGYVFYDEREGAFYHTYEKGRPSKRMFEYAEKIGNVFDNPELIEGV